MKEKRSDGLDYWMTLLSRTLICGTIVAVPLLLSGCAMFGHEPPVRTSPWSGVPRMQGEWEVATEYCQSTGLRVGYNTFEIYLTNHGKDTKRFSSVTLNGVDLPMPDARRAPGSTASIKVAGMELPLKSQTMPSSVTWWQFYPAPEVAPGETVACQINFRGRNMIQQRMSLKDELGNMVNVTVPRFRMPEKLITAVTYTLDYKRMFVQYRAKSAVHKLWVNGDKVRFKRLYSAEARTPHMLAFNAPFKITTGMPLHIRMSFEDGNWRHGLVRALNGISLHAGRFGDRPTPEDCKKVGLDVDPPLLMSKVDVACDDLKSRKKGSSSLPVLPERLSSYREKNRKLFCVGFCTSTRAELGNIYGPLGDAALAHTYQFGWGNKPNRFVDEEIADVDLIRLSAGPRPFLWAPELFKRRARYLTAQEIELLAWSMLARGTKGIRYYFWQDKGLNLVEERPKFATAINDLNARIAARSELLSPVAFVSERQLDQAQTGGREAGWVKVSTSWIGDQGLLVFVRNLNYNVSAEDTPGTEPFQVTTQHDLQIPVPRPPWFQYSSAQDLLTGEERVARQVDGELVVQVDNLAAFHVLLLRNRERNWWLIPTRAKNRSLLAGNMEMRRL